MKTLYLDCNSGISGDMLVAAFLDLGADEEVLKRALADIREEGFKIEISRVSKAGIDCCDFNVILDAEHENHDHDMEYLYGHEYHHEHAGHHDHNDEHGHDHAHDHNHEHGHTHHHAHHHSHRNLHDITEIIEHLNITDNARMIALKTFRILAEAEAKAHGRSIEEEHFHEVGAVDSIVDIVAAAVCFDNLNISEVIIPKLCEGQGTVRCQHGILPIPVPAVMNIAQSCKLPIAITNRQGELVTPTGAAFAAAVMTSSQLPEIMVPEKVGLGAGKRAYKQPSILRAVLFEQDEKADADYIWKLECNVDDCTGEQLGYVMERLMAEGARDVFYTAVYMKKNRPAWLLSVITDDGHINRMEEIMFRDTTTIGIRKQKMGRTILPRKVDTVATKYGEVEVKVCGYDNDLKPYPEYESMAALAKEKGVPLRDVYMEAVCAYKKKIK